MYTMNHAKELVYKIEIIYLNKENGNWMKKSKSVSKECNLKLESVQKKDKEQEVT